MNSLSFLRSFMIIALLSLSATALSACSQGEQRDLKSPCVGTDDSPCGPKRMVNEWWLA